MALTNLPVITLIKSGSPIYNGNIVFLTSPVTGVTQTKQPTILSRGCINPSGTYGTTDYSPLGTRFRNYGDALIV